MPMNLLVSTPLFGKGFGAMNIGIYRKNVEIGLYDFKPYTLLNFEILKFYEKYKMKISDYILKKKWNLISRKKKRGKRAEKRKKMKFDKIVFLTLPLIFKIV